MSSVEAGEKATPVHQQVSLFPVKIVHVIVIWEVPTSATELCGMMFSVVVYKVEKKKRMFFLLLKVLLLFFFCGIVFPRCFTLWKSKLQQVWRAEM